MQSSGEARCCEDHDSVPCASLGALLPPLYYRYAFHTPALSAHSTHPPARTPDRTAWSAPPLPGQLHRARCTRPAPPGPLLPVHTSQHTPPGPPLSARYFKHAPPGQLSAHSQASQSVPPGSSLSAPPSQPASLYTLLPTLKTRLGLILMAIKWLILSELS